MIKYIIKIQNQKLLWIALLAGAMFGLTACGSTAFNPADLTQFQSDPGKFLVPAKVAILFAVDDTGSMAEFRSSITQQVPKFLDTLDNMGWDYHFTTVPLTTFQNIQQVVGSKYDSNRGSSWVLPFPGATTSTPGMILSSVFSLPADFLNFVPPNSNSNTGLEPGFQNIQDILNRGLGNTNFMRPDDMFLVVVVLSTGDDTSGINYCRRPQDNVTVPCSDGSVGSSYNQYKQGFLSIKPNIKFFSVVPFQSGSQCLGKNVPVVQGRRYIDMASDLGGQSFNLCADQMGSVLTNLTSSLQMQRRNFLRRYLFIDRAPGAGSVVVSKYPGGDTSKAVTVPQDATNGWTYKGYLSNVPTIYSSEYGTSFNRASGYAIELHGTSILSGMDTANVQFKDALASTVVSQ